MLMEKRLLLRKKCTLVVRDTLYVGPGTVIELQPGATLFVDGGPILGTCEWEGVKPDGLIVGKALSGGFYPVSAFLSNAEVMDVFHPGDHGSTFGGNPVAAAVGLEALDIIVEERLAQRSAESGAWLLAELRKIASPLIRDVRGRGLFIGLEIDPQLATAREVCLRLMDRGVLSKETHETVVRLAPPLSIDREALAWAVTQIRAVLGEMDQLRHASRQPAETTKRAG